ncbi:MAG: outer membrane protein assembly factor BamD [Chitinophagales bacterium]|nr:outer membrane protein assembly factor BamD [Chitinophagales bacterium]MDW8419992.1 outer membrane protein assembly factor BamD [Chitinophagales bacterium]
MCWALICVLTLCACETPEKVLKSTNIDYKKSKAIHWYNKKEYVKCIPVLEELIGLLKGRESVEEFYYMYCMANYKQGDYLIAAYHFKNFFDQYPNGSHAEECLYMYAKSNLQLSPKPELDQTYTLKALEAYQYFFNMFPDSRYTAECNEAVSKLRKKLEKKVLNAAELYYRTQNYKAAATSYENLLIDYPDIDDNEKISFMIVKSNYKYAENSIYEKRVERFKHVIESYNAFKYKFPQSRYLAEATRLKQSAHYQIVKSAFDWADACPLADKEKNYRAAFTEAAQQLPNITDERQKQEISEWTERGYFMIIKNYYLFSETRKGSERESALQKTIQNYYTFADLYPKSKYLREAEKLFYQCTEQLKKLKTNG